ncbi:hypothetical protein KEM52_005808 [Ascosphaera acerosa]|nr:hypothetical protein KEM52_005808 [Ascosphaera acerosa]
MGTYNNPILPGSNPDPTVVRVGEDYFLATSTFEYFPGVPIYHSKDLVKWRLIGHALNRRSQLDIRTPEPGGGIWAPTLRYHRGVFYLTTCSFDRYRPQTDERVWPRGFYVSTTNIWDEQTWSDPVHFDQIGFDQDLFWDQDDEGRERCWLSTTYRKRERTPGATVKDFAIHISQIHLETGRSITTPKVIRASKSGVAEGSHLYKRGRYYYLFTAEGGTESGHCEWVHRSDKSPIGPWESCPWNPLWKHTTQDEIQNTGHADLVEDLNGSWWAVFLGVRPVKRDGSWQESVFGRETFLVPVTWEADWPIFNNGAKAALTNTGPGLYQHVIDASWRDEFQEAKLQLGWYRKSKRASQLLQSAVLQEIPLLTGMTDVPFAQDYTLVERPGYLRLYGAAYTLASPACPTILLRKQQHRTTTWRTQLDFKPESAFVEAGTALYWNYYTFSSIGVRLANDGSGVRLVRFTPAADSLDSETQPPVVEQVLEDTCAEVQLAVECSETHYRFGFRSITTAVMTRAPPVGAPFTGMMLGLYAIGENEPVRTPADFKVAEFAAA